MGVWGTGLFSDDVARDLRDFYREQIENGVEDSEATRATLENFRALLEDSEDGVVGIIALAVTQSQIGRLDADVRDRALAAIDGGADLARWEEDNPKQLPKRREVLQKAREQLTGAQPRRKNLRPPKRPSSGLMPGDVLSLSLPGGIALLRVVRVKAHRLGETPTLEELSFEGRELPAQSDLEKIEARVTNHINFNGSVSHRFDAFQGAGWEQAGFTKVANIASRPGDDDPHIPVDQGYSWSSLADHIRRKRGDAKTDAAT